MIREIEDGGALLRAEDGGILLQSEAGTAGPGLEDGGVVPEPEGGETRQRSGLDRVLQRLEFDRVREMVAARAASPPGRELALSVVPATGLDEAARRQEETEEAVRCLQRQPAVPLTGIQDLRPLVARAVPGSVLEPVELLAVSGTLLAARRLKRYLSEGRHEFPLLAGLVAALDPCPRLVEAIARCITEEGEVADGASDRLRQLRRARQAIQARIRDRLEGIVRSPPMQRYLQEPIVTQRGDRYVVPVKQEFRARLPGIIHDQSASGATVFVEPMSVVPLNNELRRKTLAEREEVERILRTLSAQVGSNAETLYRNVELLGRLDFAFARARLALEQRAVRPRLNDRGEICIAGGRHPLLGGDVVPVDIDLGRGHDILVLTGPNTGGKTVTLKMVGLLTIMAQAGLQVPAEPGTVLSVFPRIFCDIGDEQSIEQSLSTFSGHMTNIVPIVEEADDRSLVLLDEIGAGTDPQEGSALAMALLEHFRERGCKVIATTHYSELKAFAYRSPRVENASVEFDVETLRPTYRVAIGLPGRSNAFEIAARLGLKQEVVARARSFLSPQEARVDDLIGDIEAKRRQWEAEVQRLAAERRRLEDWERELAARQQRWEERERTEREDVRAEARAILKRARQEAARIVEELKEMPVPVTARERDRAIQRARDDLRDLEAVLAGEAGRVAGTEPGERDATVEDVPLREVVPGRAVYVRSLRLTGHVLTEPDAAGEVWVRTGVARVRVPVADLAQADEDGAGEEPGTGTGGAAAGRMLAARRQEVSPEISLRGLVVEEALDRLDKYLDDVYLAGLKEVRIIHGKGTGTLRRAVGELLARHPHVASFRLGQTGEGGEGVTVAILAE